MVKKHGADGGIVITSSHNDVMWNGSAIIIIHLIANRPQICRKRGGVVYFT